MLSTTTVRFFAVLLSVLTVTVATSQIANAQKRGVRLSYIEENRPFDLKDTYYKVHGVLPELIINRRTGLDKYSVLDYIQSDIYRQVRIIATSPVYGHDGRALFCVSYGDLFAGSFSKDKTGDEAREIAEMVPVYVFPSDTVKHVERQAMLVDHRSVPAEKNPLGLGVAVNVEFTARIYTKEGVELMKKLVARNGESLDGTPILKTADEISELVRKDMVKLRTRGFDDKSVPPYIMLHDIKDPEDGATAPDAYLMITLNSDGKPLPGETFFYDNFQCLKNIAKWCGKK